MSINNAESCIANAHSAIIHAISDAKNGLCVQDLLRVALGSLERALDDLAVAGGSASTDRLTAILERWDAEGVPVRNTFSGGFPSGGLRRGGTNLVGESVPGHGQVWAEGGECDKS